MLPDPISIFSTPDDPLMDIPLKTSSYRSSSQSEEILTGWEKLDKSTAIVEEEEEEKKEQDGDYMMMALSDNESKPLQDQGLTQKSEQGQHPKAKSQPLHNVSFCLNSQNVF